jgi:hypothetical protein
MDLIDSDFTIGGGEGGRTFSLTSSSAENKSFSISLPAALQMNKAHSQNPLHRLRLMNHKKK